MRIRSRAATAVLVAALTVGVAGCSVDGTATRGPIDLDTGKYAALRAKPLAEATTPVSWAKLRGVRLADHLVLPAEIDPVLDDTKLPTQPLTSPTNMLIVIPGTDTLPVMSKFEYGYVVAAGVAADTNIGINQAVIKFADDGAAVDAVKQFSDTLLGDTKYVKPGSGPVTMAGMPADSVVIHQMPTFGGETMIALTPHGSYVMYTWAQAKDRAWTEHAVLTAYQKQNDLLDKMPPESTDRNPDPTGLIRGTIETDGGGNPIERSVYGPRGAALMYSNGPKAYAAMQKAGIEHIAVNGSQAYRAGSPAQAEGWRDFLINDFNNGQGHKVASPRDLPTAKCVSADRRTGCFIAVEDYVGEVYGDDLHDAQQQISAVYTFLKK